MKLTDLATELKLSGEVVLEKAKAMGVKVASLADDISDIDATAIKNTITRSGAKNETKVARRTTKKAETDTKAGEPKVTVKAATITLPDLTKKKKKQSPTAAKQTQAAKPPVGKPIVPKEVEGRQKPPAGSVAVSKAKLEERIAKEKAEAEAAAKAAKEAKEAAKAEAEAAAKAAEEAKEAKADEAADDAAKKVAEQKNAILEKNTEMTTFVKPNEIQIT